MAAYYNEIDAGAAATLRELIRVGAIAPGDVDERSIEDVAPVELAGYTQRHFFAGFGVWSYALRCAGWRDDRAVVTGSCPCQPFSARQAKERGLLTSDISGRLSSGTSASAVLAQSLASRLHPVTASLGSTLYRLTWKRRLTRSRRSIYALRASGLPTSGKGFSGWPTPVANPANGTPEAFLERKRRSVERGAQMGISLSDLGMVSQLTGWPTPQTSDSLGGGSETEAMKHATLTPRASGATVGSKLRNSVLLAGWTSPSCRDWKDSPGMATVAEDGRTRLDQLPRQAHLAGWATPKAEDAESAGMRHTRGVADTLTAQGTLAGWPSPNATDHIRRSGMRPSRAATNRKTGYLSEMAPLAGWVTPTACSPNSLRGQGQDPELRKVMGHTVNLQDQVRLVGPARRTASGEILTGSSAGMDGGGQLNPAHPRWLMGLPSVWDVCAVSAMRSLRSSRRTSSGQAKK